MARGSGGGEGESWGLVGETRGASYSLPQILHHLPTRTCCIIIIVVPRGKIRGKIGGNVRHGRGNYTA